MQAAGSRRCGSASALPRCPSPAPSFTTTWTGARRREAPSPCRRRRTASTGAQLKRFPGGYWLLVVTCVAFYSVIFPFRSTFAIKYLQEAQGLSLEQASTLNSYVFLAAAWVTPIFGAAAGPHRPQRPCSWS